MKKVLITGKNSYIGTSLEKWLSKEGSEYKVETVDMKCSLWKEEDFSEYDVVFHVAGIAHVKQTKRNKDLYYKINRDLAFETAKKAKNEGVGHFVFLSSMSVYGIEMGVIDNRTILNPRSAYGKSKLEAEKLISTLTDKSFNVAIIRPPMVYGKGCKGNYPRLAKLATRTPLFPYVDNKRSMIFIDNLCEFVKQLIDNSSGGLFFPQNKEYVNTGEMVKLIAEVNGRKLRLTKLFNPLLYLLKVNILNKVFGDLVYDKSMIGDFSGKMNESIGNYMTCSFKESIERTEK